ncbi:MAG: Stk1 family PASTA domain-containing Ser/Thr kinase [Clostridium sp.]
MKGIVLGSRYELLEKIGEGGMAEVYKARCNKLNRFVAVKILRKQFANNEEISQKFKKEATAIANLSDTNIVNILDVGTQDDIDYIVMELVNGKTLKEFINFNGSLGYITAIKIALQIAKALDCAHKNNIIHRDIKPQNILITESGDVKVTDFGIAKSTDSSTITNTTSIIGSAHYLSPEQAKGTYVDCRADIYSFGIVLYEMVTGRLPFDGDSPVTVALKHLQENPVAPKDINSSIPDSLNKLILKAMEKEAVNRYQSAKDIIQDLQKIQQNPDVIIIDKSMKDDQHTIIMSAVSVDNNSNYINHSSKLEDDYYEEDEEDEDEEEEEEDYKYKKAKKKKRNNSINIIIPIIIGIIIFLALGFGGFMLAGGASVAKEVKVPEIVGKTVDEAKVILAKLKLEIEEVGSKKSDKAEGEILEIEPKVGTSVKEKSKVKVIVSAGIEKIKMIDLREVEVNEAIKRLSDMGITSVTQTSVFNDNIPYGLVISHDPKVKTEITEDTTVNLVISNGPEKKKVFIPELYGLTSDVAEGKLKELKIVVTIEREKTNDKNLDGKVMSQSATGIEVEEGYGVTIVVGQYEAVQIDLNGYLSVGMKVSDAKLVLKGAGINYTVNGPQGDLDIITEFTQSIKEGESVTITTKSQEVQPPVQPPAQPDQIEPSVGNVPSGVDGDGQ